MKKAVEGLKNSNKNIIIPDMLLIDAENVNMKIPQRSIIKGDLLCHGISAASILAKVERDRIMIELSSEEEYLNKYDIKSNKGYGTKKHIEAVKYSKKIFGEKRVQNFRNEL
jgi:ribonuclease HII